LTGDQDPILRSLHRYAANIPGTDGYWYMQTKRLQAVLENFGPPTIFFTLSCADYHWPDLHILMPYPDHIIQEIQDTGSSKCVPFAQRKKMVIDNPHIVTAFIHKRCKSFTSHMRQCFGCDWYWQRFEAQKRGSLHTHGCLKFTDDQQLQKKCIIALHFFLSKTKLAAINRTFEAASHSDKSEKFSDEDHKNSKSRCEKIVTSFLDSFRKDIFKHKGSSVKWYIGVRHEDESNEMYNNSVLSGEQEFVSAKATGLLQLQVVRKENHLLSIDAWTCESQCLISMFQHNFSRITNKTSVYGAGKLSCNWTKRLSTLYLWFAALQLNLNSMRMTCRMTKCP